MIDLIITVLQFLVKNVFSIIGIGVAGSWAIKKYVPHNGSTSGGGSSSGGTSGGSSGNNSVGVLPTINNGIDAIYIVAGAAVILGAFKLREYMKNG